MSVRITDDRETAIITIDNPPVNALSPDVIEGLAHAIEHVNRDSRYQAVILICAGKTFVAGGDIREFVKFTSGEKKRDGSVLLDLLERIENCEKPVIAAIHGMALGGGLELSMAAHYRVSPPNSQLGQPEVKLGIIPGAGGTQRLPRLAGVEKAVEMCTSGNPIAAQEALSLGILDTLVEGDLLQGAIRFARAAIGRPILRTRDRNEKLVSALQNPNIFLEARRNASKSRYGTEAPLAAIDAIEAATRFSFVEGCKFEQELFNECLHSEASKALIHIFFAEREASKLPESAKDASILDIRQATVVGAGSMGAGIATVFADAGIPVHLIDQEQGALDRGLASIREAYSNRVRRGRLTEQAVCERRKLITSSLRIQDASSSDILVEAVFEDKALKKEVFAELSTVCRRSAILATNTSSLSIDELAACTSRPEMVIGLHFFNPPAAMRLIEIVRGTETSEDVIATCLKLSKQLGKIGVLVRNCPEFIGNRMFGMYRREAQFLVEEGARIEDVDRSLRNFGMAMGPLETADLVGLDIRWRIRKEQSARAATRGRKAMVEDRLCEMGRFGRKSGRGWYRHAVGQTPVADAELEAQIRNWADAAGIKQRKISESEIVERCLYSLVNEGARLLGRGLVQRASDIDVIFVTGYGFPAYRGGPMWFADAAGLEKVWTRTKQFQQTHGEIWEPASLIMSLVQRGETFATFDLNRAHGSPASATKPVSSSSDALGPSR